MLYIIFLAPATIVNVFDKQEIGLCDHMEEVYVQNVHFACCGMISTCL